VWQPVVLWLPRVAGSRGCTRKCYIYEVSAGAGAGAGARPGSTGLAACSHTTLIHLHARALLEPFCVLVATVACVGDGAAESASTVYRPSAVCAQPSAVCRLPFAVSRQLSLLTHAIPSPACGPPSASNCASPVPVPLALVPLPFVRSFLACSLARLLACLGYSTRCCCSGIPVYRVQGVTDTGQSTAADDDDGGGRLGDHWIVILVGLSVVFMLGCTA
jgi:hypothetical protein